MTSGSASYGQVIKGEGRACEGPEGELEEGELLVVAGDAVGAEGVAGGAAVDEAPFAVVACVDGDGFHGSAAGGLSVADGLVDVT